MRIIDLFSVDLERVGIIGYSSLDKTLREKYKEKTFLNLIPPALIDAANKIIPENLSQVCNLETSPSKFSFEGQNFDGIIFTEVLEHLFYRDDFIMRNLWKLLKENGYLFFSIPNVAALGKIVSLLFGRNPYMSKSEQIEGVYGGYGHIREYSLSEAMNLCKSVGLKVKRIYGLNDYKSLFDKVARSLPKIYAETIMIVAQKL